MAFLGGLHKLLNRVGNTVNHDVVQPAQRATNVLLGNQPQTGFRAAPQQHIAFRDQYFGDLNKPGQGNIPKQYWQQDFVQQPQQQQGNQARLEAQKRLGFTPEFTRNVVNASPYAGKTIASNRLNNPNASNAEYFGNYGPNQIVLGKGIGQSPNVVLHEGLHRVYDTNPQVRQQFTQAYNQSATPEVKNYLSKRLAPYRGAIEAGDGGAHLNYNPNDINSLSPNLQDEAHSYVSEAPAAGIKLPPTLSHYYSRYYNPNKAYRPRRPLGSGSWEN